MSRFSRGYQPIDGVTVIGLGYRARHGKDLAASLIARAADVDVHRFALSDAISAVARVTLGMAERDPGLLQRAGYEARETNQAVWLDALYGAILDRRPTLALITGVRFPDEAAMVKAMGGVVGCVTRRNEDGSPFIAPDRDPGHPTEHGLDGYDFDFGLCNVTGRLEEFERNVLAWFMAFARYRGLSVVPHLRAGIRNRHVRGLEHEGHSV